eukprot:892043-Pyramimonas_sp.AAC.1
MAAPVDRHPRVGHACSRPWNHGVRLREPPTISSCGKSTECSSAARGEEDCQGPPPSDPGRRPARASIMAGLPTEGPAASKRPRRGSDPWQRFAPDGGVVMWRLWRQPRSCAHPPPPPPPFSSREGPEKK